MNVGGTRWARISRRVTAALAPVAVAFLAACGHTIQADLTTNLRADFDFRSYSCDASTARAAGSRSGLDVRFLGVSGLYLEWQGAGLMTTPYFSRAGLRREAFGRDTWDLEAIRAGMQGVPLTSAGVLTAHSHYDHLFDLPVIASEFAPDAALYLNRSGAHVLASYPELAARAVVLDPTAGEWIWLTKPSGERLPIRFLPLPSPHAPQAKGLHWAGATVEAPWSQPWEKARLRTFESGEPMAIVIDLMEPDLVEPALRIYYQDAAPTAAGQTPIRDTPALEGRPVDLAVLCIASHHLVEGFPERLVADLQPRHVLVTHYENFFERRDGGLRFVPLLTNRRANDFLRTLNEVIRPPRPLEPAQTPCGPASPEWTMPVPGEWLRFSGSS